MLLPAKNEKINKSLKRDYLKKQRKMKNSLLFLCWQITSFVLVKYWLYQFFASNGGFRGNFPRTRCICRTNAYLAISVNRNVFQPVIYQFFARKMLVLPVFYWSEKKEKIKKIKKEKFHRKGESAGIR